jgi:type II secretory pathway pseudopilin PulG
MKLQPLMKSAISRIADRRAFTLAEVLAAMAFIAIVVPVAIEGLHVASQAGQVAEQKTAATRVAERLLNESLVTTNWMFSMPRGTVVEGSREYEWSLNNENWREDNLRLLTVEVSYRAQGKTYSVRLSTLADDGSAFGPMWNTMR